MVNCEFYGIDIGCTAERGIICRCKNKNECDIYLIHRETDPPNLRTADKCCYNCVWGEFEYDGNIDCTCHNTRTVESDVCDDWQMGVKEDGN